MILHVPMRDEPPQDLIDDLIARHGRLPILWAAIRAALTRGRPRRMPDVDELDNHLRRDLGLPPVPGRDRLPPWY